MLARLLSVAALALLCGSLWLARADDMPLLGVGTTKAVSSCCLLDSLSATAVSAFSTRKLRNAFPGSPIRVQRDDGGAGNPQFDIGFTGTDLNTSALTTNCTGGNNSCGIITWYDQSTTPINLTQQIASPSRDPVIYLSGTMQTISTAPTRACPLSVTTAVGGTFTNSRLDMASANSVSQPLTVAALAQATAANPGNISDGNTTRVILGTSTPNWEIYAGTGAVGGTVDTSTHTFIATVTVNSPGVSSFATLYLDGTTPINAANAGPNALNSLVMPPVSQYFICEFLVFGSAISSGDRALIRASWQTYWGAP